MKGTILTTTLHVEDTAHAVPPGKSESQHPEAAEALRLVLSSLEDSKAEEVLSLEIATKTTLADYMVVASGRSHRHVGAIADHLLRDLKTGGLGSARVEGQQACDWVLIDVGDVIVHVFRPEVRTFYNIEKMWSVDTETPAS